MTDRAEAETARADGGPCDSQDLGPGTVPEYQVRTADLALHVYVRTGRALAGVRTYRYAGRR